MLVRIGSRGSRLALTQAELAAEVIRAGGHQVAFVPITTAGDRDRSSPFGQIGERGVFVKEIEEALLAGRIDVAVHSAKDMTSTDTAGLAVGAYLERDDPRDALVGADAIEPGMRIGTASVRRRAQLLAFDPTAVGRAAPRKRRHPPPQGIRARARRARARGMRPRPARAHRPDRPPDPRRDDAARGRAGRARAPGPRGRVGARRRRRLRRDAPPGRGRARSRRPDRRGLPRAGCRASRRRGAHRARRRRGRELDRAAQRLGSRRARRRADRARPRRGRREGHRHPSPRPGAAARRPDRGARARRRRVPADRDHPHLRRADRLRGLRMGRGDEPERRRRGRR